MNTLLDIFWLSILCLITVFMFLWGILAVIEGMVCFGSFLIGLTWFFTRKALIPFLKGEDGGLV